MRTSKHRTENRESCPHAGASWAIAAYTFVLVGCMTSHEVDVKPTHHTIEVEPIYMTVDINIQVQRELDRFYEDVLGETPDGEEQEEGP